MTFNAIFIDYPEIEYERSVFEQLHFFIIFPVSSIMFDFYAVIWGKGGKKSILVPLYQPPRLNNFTTQTTVLFTVT
jgi:hypothetical protein